MRDSVLWLLIFILILTSMAIVYVRHQHRVAYTLLHAESKRADALNDEWGQLLTEVNLYAFSHRIEKEATKKLKMRAPKSEEIQLVGKGASQTVEVNSD